MRNWDSGWRQFGYGIRDGKKSDPGSGINIPDPQHWIFRVAKEKAAEKKNCVESGGCVGKLFVCRSHCVNAAYDCTVSLGRLELGPAETHIFLKGTQA
jgi:hypothetical protein